MTLEMKTYDVAFSIVTDRVLPTDPTEAAWKAEIRLTGYTRPASGAGWAVGKVPIGNYPLGPVSYGSSETEALTKAFDDLRYIIEKAAKL